MESFEKSIQVNYAVNKLHRILNIISKWQSFNALLTRADCMVQYPYYGEVLLNAEEGSEFIRNLTALEKEFLDRSVEELKVKLSSATEEDLLRIEQFLDYVLRKYGIVKRKIVN